MASCWRTTTASGSRQLKSSLSSFMALLSCESRVITVTQCRVATRGLGACPGYSQGRARSASLEDRLAFVDERLHRLAVIRRRRQADQPFGLMVAGG